jgi:hypothetical protein
MQSVVLTHDMPNSLLHLAVGTAAGETRQAVPLNRSINGR